MRLTIDIWTDEALPRVTVEAYVLADVDPNRALGELASAAWRVATGPA